MNQERLNFDPVKEVAYLGNFEGESRRRQLETEVSTALSELFLSEYSHDYLWDGKEIVDKETGITAKSLAENCGYEGQRTEVVEEKLRNGDDLVVSVSYKNKELDYPDDMVDFWKRGEGDKLILMRFKVEMSDKKLKDFELINKDGYKLADLVKMLSLAKSSEGLSVKIIEEITQNLAERFEGEFGDKIFVDAELITRLFISARLELERQKEEAVVLVRTETPLNILRIEDYLYGQLKVERVAGGGCGGSSLSGEFGNGQGIIIIKTTDGISFRKGSTEGLSYCAKCGCWYSGEKCPICK